MKGNTWINNGLIALAMLIMALCAMYAPDDCDYAECELPDHVGARGLSQK